MKILIVDDDHDLLEALGIGLQLQWQGIDVLTATDGEAALTRFFDETPDVVLLDVGLPHLDGFEVLRRIRQVADTPVLMLTARGEELDKVRGLEIGADDYVTKPFSPLELLELLLRNAGRVLTRGQLIDRVWGADYVGDTKTLDVHVKRLRSKIEADPANPVHLVTVRGLGYKLEG